jgi:DNA-binding PadR family transcriptional regulator
VFQVLLSVADGERHGYAIVQDIAERSSARMRIEPGNLYRRLRDMLDDRLIEESDRRPAPGLDDERRRYYRITRFRPGSRLQKRRGWSSSLPTRARAVC